MSAQVLAMDLTLTSGFLPITFQVVGVLLLAALVVGRRSRRWWIRWLPAAALAGLMLAGAVWWYADQQGWMDRTPPLGLWTWIGATGLAAVLTALGWRDIGWRQRSAGLLAVGVAVLCAASSLNQWTDYLPTVSSAWARASGAGPAGTIDVDAVHELQRAGTKPARGTLVEVTIPATESGFEHRKELIYLPPAWYASNPPPSLPAVVMVHAEFGNPQDWPVSADAVHVLDDFAAAHDGNAPVTVFVDAAGSFSNDTECVNGRRGQAADHLTRDVVPYVTSAFGVSRDPAQWGVVGWSSGGTCALMLSTKYPNLFRSFVDIDGQRGPYAGTDEQTITRLFDGDRAAWAKFDPRSLMLAQPVTGVAGWFSVSMDVPTFYRKPAPPGTTTDPAVIDDDSNVLNPAATAKYMCELGSNHGMECAVASDPGTHSFANAGQSFAEALPWLAGRLKTPAVKPVPLPGAPY